MKLFGKFLFCPQLVLVLLLGIIDLLLDEQPPRAIERVDLLCELFPFKLLLVSIHSELLIEHPACLEFADAWLDSRGTWCCRRTS